MGVGCATGLTQRTHVRGSEGCFMNKNNKSEKVDWDRALRRLAHEHAHVRAWPRSYTEDYALATQKLRTLRGEAPRLSAIRINVELTGIADNLPEGCSVRAELRRLVGLFSAPSVYDQPTGQTATAEPLARAELRGRIPELLEDLEELAWEAQGESDG